MLAIVEMGGKQYRVSPKDVFYAELTGNEPGTEMEIKSVLMVVDGDNTKVGTPFLDNAVVKAKVLEEVKGPKIDGFKYKRRKNYHRKWGHRQKYHKLEVLGISA